MDDSEPGLLREVRRTMPEGVKKPERYSFLNRMGKEKWKLSNEVEGNQKQHMITGIGRSPIIILSFFLFFLFFFVPGFSAGYCDL